MTILLVGPRDLAELQLLFDAAKRQGGDPQLCDINEWPGDTKLLYDPKENGMTVGFNVNYNDVSGAYIHSSSLFRPTDLRFNDSLNRNVRPTLKQLQEYRAVFESMCIDLEENDVSTIPLTKNHRWHSRKPRQLRIFRDNKIPIPDTLFTNSPEEVTSFFYNHGKVIYKPVTQGGSPKILTKEDLAKSRLKDLSTAPVQFQEYIPGKDVRIYFLEGDVIGGIRYISDSFSFKIDMLKANDICTEPFEPPAEIKTCVKRAAKTTGLVFGAADIRQEPNGGFKFLELNDIPRFAAADMHCEQNISEKIIQFLMDDQTQ